MGRSYKIVCQIGHSLKSEGWKNPSKMFSHQNQWVVPAGIGGSNPDNKIANLSYDNVEYLKNILLY